MSLVINTNVTAMNVARNLTSSSNRLNKSSERLSSGLRINSAADDAAGLAIRNGMRSAIRARNQGVRNANDAISLVQTAEGALKETSAILIRMRELATQSATGTVSNDQRDSLQNEFSNLMDEIDRIANVTEFNGTKLLNGSLSGNQMIIDFGGSNTADNHYSIKINGATAEALGLKGSGGTSAQDLIAAYAAANGLISTGTSTTLGFALGIITGEPAYWNTDFDQGQTINEYRNAGTTSFYYCAQRNDGSVWFLQTNPAAAYQADGSIGTTVGTTTTDIQTQDNARQALDKLDQAIQTTNTIRANLGATQNSLNFSINYLSSQAVNLQTAESRISDVDVASETAEFSRSQILTQAAVSLLTQANALPQMALKLLG